MVFPFLKTGHGCLSLSEINAEFNWVPAVNKNGIDPILEPSQTPRCPGQVHQAA
jgi:hypothetical protein